MKLCIAALLAPVLMIAGVLVDSSVAAVTPGVDTMAADLKTNYKFGDGANSHSPTIKDLFVELMKFGSILVGIAVAGGISLGGITAATSEGNPAKFQKGITIMVNSVLGLILFLLMFAIVNWLIPGGVLK